MLKLTLVQGEAICIGEDIKLQLAPKSAYRASILIDAPKEIDIKREQADIHDEADREYKPQKSRISIVDTRRSGS